MEILDGLSRQGIIINMDQVKEHVKGRSIGRPHIAQALVRLGYAGSSREAFDNYLAVGRPAYVPRYKLGPAKAIGMIRGAGGVAVLAHPGKLKLEGNLDEWIRQGLQGIETNHPEHDSGDVRRLQMLAEDYNLIATGGSDFHGRKIKPDIRLGQWGVGLEAVGQIKDMSRAN